MNPRKPVLVLSPTARSASGFVLGSIALLSSLGAPSAAQGLPAGAVQVSPGSALTSPMVLPNTTTGILAQADAHAETPSTPPQQMDLTPVRLQERGSAFSPLQNLQTGILYYLPAKMFFDASVENSMRLETNVYQRRKNVRTDGVYRVFPNVTLGYAPTRTTRISANYFMFRDEYFDTSHLSRNIQSVGIRGDKDWLLTPRTTLTTSLFARELFITHSHNLLDLQPTATLFHRVGRTGGIYASSLLQLRWEDFLKQYQETDPFYSIGSMYRTPNWTFVWDNTLVDSFGKPKLRGGVASNHQLVMTLEAARKISPRLPLVAFLRAQPIFNMGQEKRTGYAGFDFRLFAGIRAEVAKPAIFPVKLHSG